LFQKNGTGVHENILPNSVQTPYVAIMTRRMMQTVLAVVLVKNLKYWQSMEHFVEVMPTM
jgi:hypothetical protein